MAEANNKKRKVDSEMVDKSFEFYCTPKKIIIFLQETLPFECRLIVVELVNTIYVDLLVRLFPNETEKYITVDISHCSSERVIYFTMLEGKIMKYYDTTLFKWAVITQRYIHVPIRCREETKLMIFMQV